MEKFDVKNVDLEQFKCKGHKMNEQNQSQYVDYVPIETKTFKEVIKSNNGPDYMVNIGTKPEIPRIVSLRRKENKVIFSTQSIDSDGLHYKYQYELIADQDDIELEEQTLKGIIKQYFNGYSSLSYFMNKTRNKNRFQSNDRMTEYNSSIRQLEESTKCMAVFELFLLGCDHELRILMINSFIKIIFHLHPIFGLNL